MEFLEPIISEKLPHGNGAENTYTQGMTKVILGGWEEAGS